jgi:hypothetical protein
MWISRMLDADFPDANTIPEYGISFLNAFHTNAGHAMFT